MRAVKGSLNQLEATYRPMRLDKIFKSSFLCVFLTTILAKSVTIESKTLATRFNHLKLWF